ncbi:MAG: C4-type zinc ribbon domain-containing protein [Phycisphaeraceae bacterium]
MRTISERLGGAQRRRDAQKKKLERLAVQESELGDQSRKQQATVTGLEKEVAEIDERVEKHRAAMNTVTNNKEYSALLVEMNTLKIEKNKLEEQIIKDMEQAEELKTQHATLAEQLENQKKLVERAEEDVVEARAEVGDKLDEAQAERDKAAADVPPDVITAFERLSEAYDGEAVCAVEEQDRRRKEYTCGGCYMSLPVEMVNSLIMRRDEVLTCPSCRRILYIKETLKEAIGGAKSG